jgi:RNA polymerase sigma-70 factor, ECF subfamily
MHETSALRRAPNITPDLDYALTRTTDNAVMSVEELYVRHSKRVYALCMQMTGNPADAEDLTHEVFIQLLRKIGSFRGDSKFTTWLYRLTVNQVLMHFRRTMYRCENTQLEMSSAKSASTGGSLVLERIGLETALARLPSGCRSVLLAFDIFGYRHQEIAHMLGCSVGNSKSQLHKARKKLRRSLLGQTTKTANLTTTLPAADTS